jgi:hypothetical protein
MTRYQHDIDTAHGRLAPVSTTASRAPTEPSITPSEAKARRSCSATGWSAASTWAWGVPRPGSGMASG